MITDSIIKVGLAGCGVHSHIHGNAAKNVPGVKIVSCMKKLAVFFPKNGQKCRLPENQSKHR